MLILIALLSVLLAGCVGYVIFLVHWITADCRTDSSWFFAKWFAAIGFVAGGSIVFYVGLRAFNPPPPPPGTHLCGECSPGRHGCNGHWHTIGCDGVLPRSVVDWQDTGSHPMTPQDRHDKRAAI